MSSDEPDARSWSQREALSAFLDGDDSAADRACRAWRDEPSARADWHAYQLIGELLRSENVRCEPERDALFVAQLRQRLTTEPVVLARPAASVATRRRGLRAWGAPMAVAAGFVAVAGVVVVSRSSAPEGFWPDSSTFAGAPPSVGGEARRTTLQPLGSAQGIAASTPGGALIRSAELDRYLAAHKQFSSSAVAVPGGAVRSAATPIPGR